MRNPGVSEMSVPVCWRRVSVQALLKVDSSACSRSSGAYTCPSTVLMGCVSFSVMPFIGTVRLGLATKKGARAASTSDFIAASSAMLASTGNRVQLNTGAFPLTTSTSMRPSQPLCPASTTSAPLLALSGVKIVSCVCAEKNTSTAPALITSARR